MARKSYYDRVHYEGQWFRIDEPPSAIIRFVVDDSEAPVMRIRRDERWDPAAGENRRHLLLEQLNGDHIGYLQHLG